MISNISRHKSSVASYFTGPNAISSTLKRISNIFATNPLKSTAATEELSVNQIIIQEPIALQHLPYLLGTRGFISLLSIGKNSTYKKLRLEEWRIYQQNKSTELLKFHRKVLDEKILLTDHGTNTTLRVNIAEEIESLALAIIKYISPILDEHNTLVKENIFILKQASFLVEKALILAVVVTLRTIPILKFMQQQEIVQRLIEALITIDRAQSNRLSTMKTGNFSRWLWDRMRDDFQLDLTQEQNKVIDESIIYGFKEKLTEIVKSQLEEIVNKHPLPVENSFLDK